MKNKFHYIKTLIIGFGFFGINLVWPLFNSFVPLFLQAGNPEFERQLIEAGRELHQVIGCGPSALCMSCWPGWQCRG